MRCGATAASGAAKVIRSAVGAAALSLSLVGTAAAQQVWRVGPDESIPTIGAAVRVAQAGDTIRVGGGEYHEQVVVERPVTMIGEGWPTIDADGRGHVVEAHAEISIEGFVIRGSGTSVDREDSGVMVREGRARVVGNRFEDVLYGVYLKGAPGSTVAGNDIRGKELPLARRGDGIRLWYSPHSSILDNTARRVRDVVVYFSDDLVMRGNAVSDARYGLHYMYSHHSRVERNRVSGSQVGAFLMYSTDLEVVGNVFAEAEGATGIGLGLKDADDVHLSDNLFVDNSVGIHLDNSPRSVGARNQVVENAFVANGSAVRMLPAVSGNRFAGNAFEGNEQPAEVAGGMRRGQVRQNEWSGNYWDEYAGFDEDNDGSGDAPFVHARLADALMSRHPGLRFFARSPVVNALDIATRLFPTLRPEPVVVDNAPRLQPAAIERWRREGVETSQAVEPTASPGRVAAWIAVLAASVGAVWWTRRGA